MSEHTELLEIAELYAFGGLGDSERAQLEQHVADGCAECEALLRANLDIAAQLLLAVGPVEPARAVHERLFARVNGAGKAGSAPAPGGSRSRRGWLLSRVSFAAAAGVFLVLGLSGLSALLGVRLAREREIGADLEDALAYAESIAWSLARDMESERSRRVAAEQHLGGLSRIVSALESPLARSLALSGQGDFKRAVAKAYIEPESGRLILYAHNLPPVPDGHTYQIWVIVEDRHLSAGLFRSDSSGEAKYDSGRLQNLAGPVTVAVTLEAEGGAPQPTGPIVLAGS